MSHEKSRREVLLGSAAIAAALAAPSIAKSKSGGSSARVFQGGTNPIVRADQSVVKGRPGSSLGLILYPADDDIVGDSYDVQAWRIRPECDKDGVVTFKCEKVDIEGIKDKSFFKTVKFTTGSNETKPDPEPFSIHLDSTTDPDIVTVAVYRRRGTRSSISTFEVT